MFVFFTSCENIIEDGHETKAHRIILSAGSVFFNDIFTRSKNHPNMYVFLKGVNRRELEQITDFLYNGEASINQDEMNQFFEATKLLQIKGLQANLKGMGQDLQEVQKSEFGGIERQDEKEYIDLDDVEFQETFVQ